MNWMDTEQLCILFHLQIDRGVVWIFAYRSFIIGLTLDRAGEGDQGDAQGWVGWGLLNEVFFLAFLFLFYCMCIGRLNQGQSQI